MAALRMAALVAVAAAFLAFPPGPASGDTSVESTLTEFAITAAPSGAEEGSVTFEVSNGGVIPHNFLVIDTDLAEDALPLTTDGLFVDESRVNVVGGTSELVSGAFQSMTLDLPAGSYVLICNNAASHYTAGMRLSFQVSGQAAPTSPPPEGGEPTPGEAQPTQVLPVNDGNGNGGATGTGSESTGSGPGTGAQDRSNSYWWVLPVLAAAGAGVVVLGTAARRRKE